MRAGYNMGRKYFIRAGSHELCERVSRELAALVEEAKLRGDRRTWFERSQAAVKALYDSPVYLNAVSFLLILVTSPPLAVLEGGRR